MELLEIGEATVQPSSSGPPEPRFGRFSRALWRNQWDLHPFRAAANASSSLVLYSDNFLTLTYCEAPNDENVQQNGETRGDF